MKEIIQILTGYNLLFSSNRITAQTTEKKLFQSSLMFAHDILLPLFGNAFELSSVQKITKRNSFIPVVMCEFRINSRFWFGLKAGHQTYSETMQRSTNLSAPGELHEIYNNESILGGNVYGKYILRQDKILQPYVGGGFGC